MGTYRKWMSRLAVVASWYMGSADAQSRAAEPVDPIYWKQTVFSIPYQINRPATAEDAPLEVRLLLSQDGGANWKPLQSAQPRVKGFVYNAEQDGHYWFAVQTVDRFGRVQPSADIRPELHVVVDTSPPGLELVGEVKPNGEVMLRCQEDEANPRVDSLSISVAPETGQVQHLQVARGEADGSNQRVHSVSWTPPVGTRSLQIRAEATDLAGNRGIAQIELDLLAASQRPVSSNSAAVPLRPVRQNNPPQGLAANRSDVWNSVNNSPYPQTPFGALPDPKTMLLDPPKLADGTVDGGNQASAESWPVDGTAMGPPTASSSVSGSRDAGGTTPAGPIANFEPLPAPRNLAKPAWSAQPASMSLPGGASSDGPTETAGGTMSSDERLSTGITPRGAQNQPVASEEIPAGEVMPSPTSGPGRALGGYPDTGAPSLNLGGSIDPTFADGRAPAESSAAGGGWQMVNSRTIAIDYEVASVGPWGVSQVELWGTRDGGQTWRRYATDDDNRSPVTATVEGEGDYGFRVVVHSAGGFAATPPQAGDAPEALVRVDLVRPEATIESVQQGTGNAADQILIRWSANDSQLAPQPVTLYYSAQPAGPWTIIAAGLPNTGSYAWRAERHLPEQLYVRLEVRDAAGNTTTFQTAQPVVVSRPRPQVRIREIRSFQSSPAQANSGP